MIYLDNAATTKPCKEAIEAFNFCNENFFNPSGNYIESVQIGVKINQARQTILNKIHGAKGYKLLFTSGATEADNLAVLQASKFKNKTILVNTSEHSAVYESVKQSGLKYKEINLLKNGQVDEDHLKVLLSENDVSLVAIMFVNNETGAINDIVKLSKLVKKFNNDIMFLCDGVQGFCKFPINIESFNVEFLTLSAHKVNGYKGVGALIYKENINLKTAIFGGGQEFNLRSGTENVGGILSFAAAVEIERKNDLDYIKELRQIFIDEIKELDNIMINSDEINPYILNISVKGVRSEVVVRLMSESHICISSGSACHSRHQDNRVLRAMGIDKDFVLGTNRFSFCLENTSNEVKEAARIYVKTIKELRK